MHTKSSPNPHDPHLILSQTCETLNKHCPNFKKLNINLRNDKPTGEVLTLLNKATRGFVK